MVSSIIISLGAEGRVMDGIIIKKLCTKGLDLKNISLVIGLCSGKKTTSVLLSPLCLVSMFKD